MFPELIQKVREQLKNKLPFVVYKKPQSETVSAILQNDVALHHTSDFSETGFVFAPFDTEKEPILLKIDKIVQSEVIGESILSTSDEAFTSIETSQKAFHINLVEKGIKAIENGTFDKVVLSRKFQIDSTSDPLELFQKLLTEYPAAFCYLWYHPKVGIWVGATPEILLRTENKQFTTMSLAGTKLYRENEKPVWGAKEKNEQALVTQYITAALEGKVSNLSIAEVESVRAGKLWHLRTKLSGTLHSSMVDVIQAMHPTPAVCGLPLLSAKNFIEDNEGYDREFYTGFLGELNFKLEKERTSNRRNQENKAYRAIKTKTELFVNLRCMKLEDQKAHVYVGGGVTKASLPEKEWEETVNKGKTMLRVLLGKK